MIKKIFLFALLQSAALYPQGADIHAVEKEAAYNSQLTASEFYKSDTTMDARYYKLDLKIDEAAQTISGSAEFMFASLYGAKSGFFLDLSDSLTVDSILSPQGTQLSFTHEEDKIFFTAGKTLNAGETYAIKVYYHGTPPANGFGSFVFSERNGYPSIWTLSEPFGSSDWFPCKNTPADKADSSAVWMTCDSSLMAVSNGLLIAETDNGDGTKTYKWKESYPIAHYLISMAISKYDKYFITFNYGSSSMPVENYVYHGELTTDVKSQLDRTLTALEVFSDMYGLYPFINEKYGHAHFGWGGGMEHQTISSMVGFNEGIMAHELAHQWFGDKITCADWHNIWLNEGFATYSEGLYYEKVYGKESYESFMSGEMSLAKRAKGSIYVQDITSVDEIFDGDRTYAKGAVVLHMLRGVVGDDNFFNIIKTYASSPEHVYGTAKIEDFREIAEEIYGGSLAYFFNEWLYGENFPEYTFSWSSEKNGSGYAVSATISQKENANPSYFTMPLDIRVTMAGKDTTVRVFNDKQTQTFAFNVSEKPEEVELDPYNLTLKKVLNLNDIPLIPNAFRLEQNYPNPFNPDTYIKFSIPEYGRVKVTVYDSLGKEIKVAADEEFSAGEHNVHFKAEGLASGVYVYKTEWNGKVLTGKMMLIK